MTESDNTVAIIGGGYAGMAAAVELARAGIGVEVFEATDELGGRARRVGAQGTVLDNGLHILVGAYRETLRLLSLVTHASDPALLRRIPLELEIHDRFHLKAGPMGYPMNLALALLRAKGLGLRDKFSIAMLLQRLKASRYKLNEDVCVEQLLRAQHQSDRANRYLWYPLCTAALNTSPGDASAQVFVNVLRDTFSTPGHNSDLLLPVTDLSTLFPVRAARFVQAHGSGVHLGTRVTSVRCAGADFDLQFREHTRRYSRVVVAVAPQHVTGLMSDLPDVGNLRAALSRFDYRPIYSVYFGYPPDTRLPKAMLGLEATFTQWIFDRGQLCGQHGVIGVVISASGAHQEISQDDLAARVDGELRTAFPQLPRPHWYQVIAEKRATFACTPRLKRPSATCSVPGLFLAGDYLDSEYPATLEAAVRSGVRAAQLVMEHR